MINDSTRYVINSQTLHHLMFFRLSYENWCKFAEEHVMKYFGKIYPNVDRRWGRDRITTTAIIAASQLVQTIYDWFFSDES